MIEGRRDFLKGIAGLGGGITSLGVVQAAVGAPIHQMDGSAMSSTVRDKLWIWGHVEGSLNGRYGLPGNSRMTPAEGAYYLGVPNVILVAYRDPKEPSKMLPDPANYDEYGISFRPLKRVLWSIVGGGGRVDPDGLISLGRLAREFPNITGAFMDDFFRKTLDGGREGVFTPSELSYVQSRLNIDDRRLDLWVTVHDEDLNYDVAEYLRHVDVVTYWTWKAKDLDSLEEGFVRAEKAAPQARKVLGCFMWDFGESRPMPIANMEKQCSLGLQWLRNRRVDGMIFLASCICDLNIEAVEWTRRWIDSVGDTRL